MSSPCRVSRRSRTERSNTPNNGSTKKTKNVRNEKASDDSYAGDDSSVESVEPSRQKYRIGMHLSKVFDGQSYSGKITRYHPKEGLYSILYEDGDTEDLEEGEIAELLERGQNLDDAKESKNNKSNDSRKSNDSDSDDSDDDPFSHLGKTTKRRKMITYSDSDSDASSVEFQGTSSTNKKKKVVDSSDDSSSDELFRAKTSKAATKRTVELDDDDSDSDIELLTSKNKSQTRRSPRKSKSPPKKASSSKLTATKTTESNDTQLRAKSCEALEQSKRAREAMKKAQGYHAEDVDVPSPQCPNVAASSHVYNVDDDSEDDLEPLVVATKPSIVPTPIIYSGSILRLTLRYKDNMNKNAEKTLRIKSDEPLRLLKDRFQGGSIVSLKFDGRILDLNKTPQFYEMEDEDLLDAVVQNSIANGSAASNVVKLSIRRSETNVCHEFGMPNTAPLSKLIAGVCEKFKVQSVVLQYNGRELEPAKTCLAMGIPNGAMIDAVTGKIISLEFRVNGNSKDVYTINAMQNGTFKHAMEAFATKKKCSLADCKFLFDGEVLQSNTTMESLDLEGDEIIDVKWTIAAAASNPPPLEDDDGDVIMADAAPTFISIKTVRNVSLSCDSKNILKADELKLSLYAYFPLADQNKA